MGGCDRNNQVRISHGFFRRFRRDQFCAAGSQFPAQFFLHFLCELLPALLLPGIDIDPIQTPDLQHSAELVLRLASRAEQGPHLRLFPAEQVQRRSGCRSGAQTGNAGSVQQRRRNTGLTVEGHHHGRQGGDAEFHISREDIHGLHRSNAQPFGIGRHETKNTAGTGRLNLCPQRHSNFVRRKHPIRFAIRLDGIPHRKYPADSGFIH